MKKNNIKILLLTMTMLFIFSACSTQKTVPPATPEVDQPEATPETNLPSQEQVQESTPVNSTLNATENGAIAASGTANNSGNASINIDKAKEIALSAAGVDTENVVYTSLELDYDNGGQEFDVEFVAGDTRYSYEINAQNGVIIQSGQRPIVQINSQNQAYGTAGGYIGVEAAKAAAINAAGTDADAVVFINIAFERDDGVSVYEIDFVSGGTKYDYEIQGNNGNILEASQEPVNQVK